MDIADSTLYAGTTNQYEASEIVDTITNIHAEVHDHSSGTIVPQNINIPYLSGIPAGVTNGSIWMESDGLHIYYHNGEKIIVGV